MTARQKVVEERVELRGLARRMKTLGEVSKAGLAITYPIEAQSWSPPRKVAIKFTGSREGGDGQPGDSFESVEWIEGLGAGGDRVALTARICDIRPGTWHVLATPVAGATTEDLPPRAFVTETTLAPLAQGPAVRLLAWPALVVLGGLLAVIVQALLLRAAGMPVAPVVALTILACLLGLPGGRLWVLGTNRRPLRDFLDSGASITGFLFVALAVISLGAAVIGVPVGTVLDATTPGIFLGVAVGRPGCLLTGCCAGRPTGSKWGLRSSDRRLLIRRVPVQLVEAALGAAIGAITLMLQLWSHPAVPGTLMAGALAAYALGRQALFPLRAMTHTRTGRITAEVLGVVVLVAVALSYVTR